MDRTEPTSNAAMKPHNKHAHDRLEQYSDGVNIMDTSFPLRENKQHRRGYTRDFKQLRHSPREWLSQQPHRRSIYYCVSCCMAG